MGKHRYSPHDYEFNHGFVGITNPSNQLSSPSSSSCKNDLMISSPCSSTLLSSSNIEATIMNEFNKKDKKYRIIRFKKVVGKGDKTYQILKNAILQWSPTLQQNNWAGIHMIGSKNIKRIINEDVPCAPLPASVSDHVLQVWNNGGRRLVTFSRVFGSRLFCMNPCLVIYDLVDEKQDDCDAIFTSTAYATLKGHFLCGEERVTVGIQNSYNKKLILEASNNNFHFMSSSSSKEHDNDDDGQVFVEILSCSRPNTGILGNVMFHFVKNMQLRFFKSQLDTLQEIAKDCNSIGDV